MHFFLLILFVCFFLFLFYLHFSAKEDFVFIRKNVSLEQLFNAAFLAAIAALLSSRLFYVFYHPSWKYLNPFLFLAIPYFPGLSVSGAVIGALVFLYFYGKSRRLPAGRITDFFSVAFLLAAPFGFLISAFLSTQHELLIFLLAAVMTFILFFFFMLVLFPKLIGGQYKDGKITYLFLMNFPLVFLLSQIISRAVLKQFYFMPEDGVLLGIFLLGVILYLKQEQVGSRKRITR